MSAQLGQKDQEKQAVQSELDDLLMVFADLEEKASKYKVGYVLGSPVLIYFCSDTFTSRIV